MYFKKILRLVLTFGHFYKKTTWESLFRWTLGVIKSHSIPRRTDSERGTTATCLGRPTVMSVSKPTNQRWRTGLGSLGLEPYRYTQKLGTKTQETSDISDQEATFKTKKNVFEIRQLTLLDHDVIFLQLGWGWRVTIRGRIPWRHGRVVQFDKYSFVQGIWIYI